VKLEWDQVVSAMGAGGPTGRPPVSGWSIDTRTLEPGDLFFALRGPNHDGHEHVRDALARGAAGAVVERGVGDARPLLIVDDTLAALQRLAAWARAEWGGQVVGVTGSAGKTTTKDMIAQLLATALPIGKTIGNYNNHFGVPLSILRLPDLSWVAVLEMGMNHAGEIRALAGLARPDVGVVTNVGFAHVEFFDSIEGVAAAKRELIESLPPRGTAVLNADDPYVASFARAHRGRTITYGLESGEVRPSEIELGDKATRFRLDGRWFETTATGRHNLLNWMAAFAVARVFEVDGAALPDAVRTFRAGKMRGERLEWRGAVIWNDCYNANPEAMRSTIDLLGATPARRRIAVLGEMLELGKCAEPLHREVGKHVAERGIDVLIGIRGAARHMVDEAVRAGMSGGAAHFFEEPAAAGDFARDLLREGDAVLFKGSRGIQVERALERVLSPQARDEAAREP
jgi:UDP-N-acetylmuramoyl-tripeptide--D-alanyl-D-alanine ligase